MEEMEPSPAGGNTIEINWRGILALLVLAFMVLTYPSCRRPPEASDDGEPKTQATREEVLENPGTPAAAPKEEPSPAPETPPVAEARPATENAAAPAAQSRVSAAPLPGPDQAKVEAFLLSKGYESWSKQPAHLSGANVDGVNYAVHGFIQTYFSPGVDKWINAVPAKVTAGPNVLPNNEMIIALEYAATPEGGQGALQRIHSMVKQDGGTSGGSFDGWFWSTTAFQGNPGSPDWAVDPKNSFGNYGASQCVACHAATEGNSLVFLSKHGPFTSENNPALANWKPDAELAKSDPPAQQRKLITPLPAADPNFLTYFEVDDVPDAVPFPSKAFDHVFPGNYSGMSKTEKELYITSNQCIGCHNAAQLLSNSSPNMWYPEPDPETTLVDGPDTPDSKVNRNFSAYGEWSASLNALSGRDPVWHAQVDFERKLRGNDQVDEETATRIAHFTTDTCFTCHGPMAGRQLKVDRGPDALFTIDKFYATPENQPDDAKYGALARDGVSCAVCHQIPAEQLGEDPHFEPRDPEDPGKGYFVPEKLNSYTAMFDNPPVENGGYWGPYQNSDVLSIAMDKALGQKGAHGPPAETSEPSIRESKLCGTCHTVLVPALPVGFQLPEPGTFEPGNPFGLPKDTKMSFEQTTYFEWRNSRYENETTPANLSGITCQNCHMASHKDTAERIVNFNSDRFPPQRDRLPDTGNIFKKQDPIYRHVLLGINLFVFEMYEQFPDILGSHLTDPRVPEKTLDSTLNARDWIENHAKSITADVRITDIDEGKITPDNLEVEVEVTNFAGHKFPTGAGFRRAFIQFEVLGANDEVLWASGRTSPLGVLLDANDNPLQSEETIEPSLSQPHHQIITSQNQVQIYETRAMNSDVDLQTTVLGIYYEYKDNRILPLGYVPPEEHDIVSRKATGSALVGNPEDQPTGVVTEPPAGVPAEATEHPTTLDSGEKPFEVVYDPDYWLPETARNGQDHVRYRVPLKEIEGWEKVRARLFYQTIPPYYLRDRFETGKVDKMPKDRDMNRLIHIASRLNLKDTPGENWSLKIGEAAEKPKGASPDPRLGYDDAWRIIKEHYTYLKLP